MLIERSAAVGSFDTADVFAADLATNTIELVSRSSTGEQALQGGRSGTISSDGRVVAFISQSDNLVENDTNHEADVFIRGPGQMTATASRRR
jgi:Tol biopolymer transport system component